MNISKDKPVMLIVVLTLICVVASLALAFTYMHCRDRIFAQIEQIKQAALEKVIPAASRFETITKKVANQGDQKDYEYTVGYDEAGKIVGYAFEGSASGYSSTIVVIVGVDTSAGTITGISVTSQQETPGLGANIEAVKTEGTLWSAIASIFSGSQAGAEPPEPYFQAQFRGKILDNLSVVKEKGTDKIEALTGATISSEAVTKAVRDAVNNFRGLILEKEEE